MRLSKILSTFFLLCLLVIIAPAALGQESSVAAPRVVDTTPGIGEELGLSQPIVFTFDRPMDTENSSNEFAAIPVAGGNWAWTSDRELVYSPGANDFMRDTEYRFSVFAIDADGRPMNEPHTLTVQTVGFIQLVDVIPAPETEQISVDSDITLIFNRPVVPLVSLSEQADLPDPISFEPDVAGAGQWINTSIYRFSPETALAGGITYAVTVQGGLESLNGAILPDDITFGLSTANPTVQSVSVSDGAQQIPLDVPIDVTFSQAIDQSTQNGVQLVAPTGAAEPVMYSWSEDGRTVTIQPQELLQLGTLYDIVVDSSVVETTAGSQLDSDYRQEFLTVPSLAIVRTNPADGEQNAEPFGGFRIYFSAPVTEDSLQDKVVISPEPARDFDSFYYSYDNSYGLFFDLEPSTDYTIRILPGIEDPYGNQITEERVINFRTDQLGPEVTINSPDFVGLYNGAADATRLFITHRNISELNFALARLPLRTLADMLGPNGYNMRFDYSPPPSDIIRSWTVPVEAQLNQRRYELLFLSERGGSGVQNVQCLGAPETRLAPGATARIADDDPTPTRVRTAPNLGGQIITQYLPGESFEVRGGPICADGFLWWQIYNPTDDVEGWIAEGVVGNYFIEPIEVPTATFDGGEELPPLAPGIYFLSASSPETAARNIEARRHALVVATANITFKFSQSEGLAWVTDMENGAPIANVPVTFFDEDFNTIATAVTDAEGLARVSIPRLRSLYTSIYTVVDTGMEFGFVTSGFSQGIDPWRFEIQPNFQPSPETIYLYTDRPIYRPGQPVYFRGIYRDQDDANYTAPPAGLTLPLRIFNAQGEVIDERQITTNPYGSFSGEFMIGEDAGLGYYRVTVEAPQGPQDNFAREYSVGFNVAEYRAPEFQVDVIAAEPEVAQGDTVQIAVESSFFFGGPVSNAEVEYTVLGANYFFEFDGPGRWQFFDFNYDDAVQSAFGQDRGRIAEGTGVTDDEGRFIIEIPAELGEQTQSQEYTIEARVTDESDQLVAGRTRVIVHQGNFYVGLQPQAYVQRAGDEAAVNVLTVDWDSDTVAGREVDYRIVERRWSSVQEEDEFGRTVWRREVEEIQVADGQVTTDDDGRATINFTPESGGTYKVYASSRDSDGNLIQSSAFLWVSGREYIPWRQQNSNRIDLIADADSYSVGDTAEILIASPFQGEAQALVTVERGSILQTEIITMESNSYVYELPIEDAYAPNVFVSVIIMKGIDENTPYTQFRAGLVKLSVETDRLEIDLEVTPDIPDGETPGPGDEVVLNVRATDYQGNPVQAEVGIGVTDLAILTLAPPNTQALLEYFYGERGISVRTATALTISVDQVTQTIIDTVKGGGGGGADAGIFNVRQNFVDTPLWAPDVVTDENGAAQVTVTLPDNLTTWRIDTRAVTSGQEGPMLVGTTTTDFISTKPLLVRPVTPRFMIVDDELNMGVIVNNNTESEQTVDVQMQGMGYTILEGTPTRTVTIPAGARQRVNWLVRVEDVEFVDVFFAAQSTDGAFSDAARPAVGVGEENRLPVYRYTVRETVGTSGTLDGPASANFVEIISLPPNVDDRRGDLTVQVDRSLAGPTLAGLDALRNYDVQGIETTISRFLPNIITLRTLQTLGRSAPELQGELDAEVNFALQQLFAQQRVDGGWGWFPNDDADPLMTAYASIGLLEAQRAGYDVEPARLDRAYQYLNSWLLRTENDGRIAEDYILNQRAFVLYALSYAGQGNASRLSSLYNVRDRLNIDALSFLTMSLYLMDVTDTRLATLQSDLVNAAVISATGVHWEDRPNARNWTTSTRSTALALMALTILDADNDLLPGAVRWLIVARDADAWETTQETAWAVMAFNDWMLATDELNANYEFTVRLNDDEIIEGQASTENVTEDEVQTIAIDQLLLDELNRLSLVKTQGEGNLYYTAHVTSFQPVPDIEAVAQGIVVNRQYSQVDDADNRPITEARVGDEVRVTVTIIAPRNLHYVVVEDPIPAGAEAIDPNLLTSSVLEEGPQFDREDPFGRGYGWWWFSRTEFRDEKVVLYATYLPSGTYTYTYTLRMGLEGEYNVIPTTGQEFYFPEVYGRGDGMLFTILPELERSEVAGE
jgi:alpha-2-macroglobulin